MGAKKVREIIRPLRAGIPLNPCVVADDKITRAIKLMLDNEVIPTPDYSGPFMSGYFSPAGPGSIGGRYGPSSLLPAHGGYRTYQFTGCRIMDFNGSVASSIYPLAGNKTLFTKQILLFQLHKTHLELRKEHRQTGSIASITPWLHAFLFVKNKIYDTSDMQDIHFWYI